MPGGLFPPPEVIQSWPKPNYEDPESENKAVLVLNIVFPILVIVFVLLRLYTRIWIKRQAGLDDVLIVLATIPTLGIGALLILVGSKFRWFRHVWDVPPDSIAGRELHSWVVQLLFVFGTAFGKMSILVLYKRVIKGVAKPRFMAVVNGMIIVLILYTVTFFLLMVLSCRPVEAYWLRFSYPEPYQAEYSCFVDGQVQMANAVVSVITDFISAMLPMFLFWQLHIPLRERIALSILFGLGFVVCALGIVRSVIIHHLFYTTYDVTWLSHKLWAFLQVENSMTIICASTPPLNSLLKKVRGIPDHLPLFRRPSQATVDITPTQRWSPKGYAHMRSPNQTQSSGSRNDPIEMVDMPARQCHLSQISDIIGKRVTQLTRSRLSQPLPPLPKEVKQRSEGLESGT